MVEVIKDICNSGSPRMHRRIVLTCDECGTNVRELYRHNGEEKCMDCLLQDLMDDGTIEFVSIPE